MVRYAVAIAFTFGLLVIGSQAQIFADSSTQASLQSLLQVLNKANVSGSLEFSGHCDSFDMGHFPEFPALHSPETSGGSTLQTVRQMFVGDPAMQVTQDPDGTIRMIERGVATDILNVWIARIPFRTGQPPADHDPNTALTHILAAPEVERFMKAQDIEWPFVGEIIGILGTPQLSAPHIAGAMDNLTFSEAMDHILNAFPGTWIYENCPGTDKRNRIVYFRFYRLQETGSGETVQ